MGSVRNNPLQFAVVREDPAVEQALVERTGAERVLLVASGGCTGLTLASQHPGLALTLFDRNPHQLAHCERKREALALRDLDARRRAFNVGTDDPRGLNACGNFESLFRGLRSLIADLVAPDEELSRVLRGDAEVLETMVDARYWPTAFDLFFSDPMLLAMFGPEAVQHAPPGSYPRYFQSVFERGLARADAGDNYFLHHVLLGRYLDRPEAWPPYLRAAPCTVRQWLAICGTLEDVPELERYDLVSLSNLFDWMDRETVARTCEHLADRLAPGATIVVRQLNSALDLAPLLCDRFALDEPLAGELLARDRSLFYERLWIGRAR